jgi:hypothetical protein
MRKLILLPVLLLCSIMFAAAQPAEFQFNKDSHDFGTFNEGDKASFVFTFKNTGSEPLLISKVKTSCACLVVDYTKEAIAPGQSGQLTVNYISTERPGTFHKSITISSNAKTAVKILTVKGNVIGKSAEPLIKKPE